MVEHINLKKPLVSPAIILASGCTHQDPPAEGYLDADYIYIPSPSSGLLQNVTAEKGQYIEKSTLLFSLDSEPERQQRLEAKSLAEIESAYLKDLESGKRKE